MKSMLLKRNLRFREVRKYPSYMGFTSESSVKDKVGIPTHFPSTSPGCSHSVLQRPLEGSVDVGKEGVGGSVGGSGAFREILILQG